MAGLVPAIPLRLAQRVHKRDRRVKPGDDGCGWLQGRDMTVRAAIIGLGRWGRSLVNAVHGKTDAIRFTAAYTRTRVSAEDFCRENNIPMLARFEDALASPDIDAVVLATPHSMHAEQVMAAAVAGKHIHVEKPLTLDRPSAEAAVAAAKRAGIVLAVGFNRRFHPSVVEIRKRLADGRLGTVMSMVAQHTTSTGQFIAPGNWRAQPDEAPGGALTAVGVHSIDHMIEFAGEVRDVLATTGSHHSRAIRRHHQCHVAIQERRHRASVLLGRDRDRLQFHALRQQGARGDFATESAAVPLCAGLDRGADRAGHRAAGRDHRAPELRPARHAQRRTGRVRPLHRRETALPGRRSTRCCTAWRCSTPWYDRQRAER